MLKKLKDFFGIVEGRDTAVACRDCCGWDNGDCSVSFPNRRFSFHPEKGWIEGSHGVSPWKENRFGRCQYYEARRESGPLPSAIVCTLKRGGFDLEIWKAELEEALGGPVHSATEVEGKKPYPYFREKEERHE